MAVQHIITVIPTKASTQEFDYVFSGWDKDYQVVTENMSKC